MTPRLRFAAALVAAGLALSACGAGERASEPATETVTATHVITPSSLAPSPVPAPVLEQLQPQLQAAVDAVVAQYGGTAELAVSDGRDAVGSPEQDPQVAWSTSKVPIAVAALRKDPSLLPVAESAITASDNFAAETLWATVEPAEVEAVLREAGVDLPMNTVVLRPGFTAFGQTRWGTREQAVFASNLRCVAGADEVLDMMRKVVPEQRYGLGVLPDVAFKGGWGPGDDGKYTVRQLGLYNGYGIALTVSPADGTYATAQLMVTDLANAVLELQLDSPKPDCSSTGR